MKNLSLTTGQLHLLIAISVFFFFIALQAIDNQLFIDRLKNDNEKLLHGAAQPDEQEG